MFNSPAPRILAASLVALLTAASSLAQTTYTWTGGGPTNAWSEALNWSVTSGTGNPPPPSDIDSTVLALTGNTQTTNVLDQNLSANRLTFDANAGSFVVGGGSTLTVGTGGIAINNDNNQTVNANLAAGSGTSWLNNGTGLFTVNGTVNIGGFQISVGGNGHSVFGGVISGTGGLTKVGNGTVTLTGNNTFTGISNVLSGALVVGAGGAISGPPETSAVGVIGTGTLSIASGGSVTNQVIVFGANARVEGSGTANIVALGAIDGNGDPVGSISGGVNGVGRLTMNDLIFGTGATQRVRIATAGVPAALNTGGSSGGTTGNPANNNYLRVSGSLFTNALLFGGAGGVRDLPIRHRRDRRHVRAGPVVQLQRWSGRREPPRFLFRRYHDRRRAGRTGAVQHRWFHQRRGLLVDTHRSGGCVPELHHRTGSRADDGAGPRGRDVRAWQTSSPALPPGDPDLHPLTLATPSCY